MADQLDHSEPSRLARAMALDPTTPILHTTEELAAILQHQLDTALSVDLPDAGGSSLTFGQLLLADDPPIELLDRVKSFAKFCKSRSGGPLPVELGTVLYFASIIRALDTHHRKISALSDAGLAEGARWALAQPWVTGPFRAVFERR